MSRNNRVTLATFNECPYIYHKQDKKNRWRTNEKKSKHFIVKAIASGTIVSLTNQEGHYKQRSQRSRITKQVFVHYHVFEISGNSKGGQVPKRGEHKNFIPFYVLLSFLVCINTDSKVQIGATLFKTALKGWAIFVFWWKADNTCQKKDSSSRAIWNPTKDFFESLLKRINNSELWYG